jgi:hypothetical protein
MRRIEPSVEVTPSAMRPTVESVARMSESCVAISLRMKVKFHIRSPK